MHAVVRSPASFQAPAGLSPMALVARVMAWIRLYGERRALARLDRRMLDDIGVTPLEAGTEAMRPFWDRPAGRL